MELKLEIVQVQQFTSKKLKEKRKDTSHILKTGYSLVDSLEVIMPECEALEIL